MEINLKNGEGLNKVVSLLEVEKKDKAIIDSYHKEFEELDRTQRESQVGKIQKDKFIGKDGNRKKVTAVRVPIAFANKIVTNSVAFEFGLPVKLTPEKQNGLSDQVLLDWKNCRLNHKLQKAKIAQKKETQSALLFEFKDLKQGIVNKVIGANKNRAISCKVLDHDDGEFFPYFDETGDMQFFIHKFQTKLYTGELYEEKIKEHFWIYDEIKVTKMIRNGSGWSIESSENHGFSKIPAVYMSQDKPEHYLVKDAIDRIEVAISKLGNANDYSGHPILFIEGEIYGLPDKNADGKVMKTKMEVDENGKSIAKGDARFLTHDNAPESVKLEIETLEKYIYAMTSTPDISFTNLKSVGNISEATLELMFLDCTLKKLMNEGQNRTDVERCINIIISGIITTSKASYKNLVNETFFDVEFPSVLPNNFQEKVTTVALAVSSGIMSKETAIEMIGATEDLDDELEKIRLQSIELDFNPEPEPQD